MPSLEDLTVDQLLARAKELEAKEPQANLMSALLGNPTTREMTQRAMKLANPKLVIPEIDAGDRVMAAVTEERTKREALENRLLEREAADRVRERRQSIKTKYELSDADVEKVEALMLDKENPIGNHDAAARVFLASRQSATPTPASFQAPTFTMPEKEKWGPAIGNPAKLNRIAIDEAYTAWSEIVGGKHPGLSATRAV